MRDIQAAVTGPHGATEVHALQLEEPRADEVLVRLVGVGICHTDVANLTSTRTPKPIVLGHEGAGVVEAVGAGVLRVVPGDRVVLTFPSCGRCASCLAGVPAYCRRSDQLNFGGRRLDGSTALRRAGEPVASHYFGQSSFASYALAYERNCVKAPDDLPLEMLGPLGCGVQTGAGTVLNTLKLGPRHTLAVAGVGAVGLSAVMAAVLAGVQRILAIDIHADRLALARALGATDTIDASACPSLREAVLDFFPDGLDAAIDTSGHLETLRVLPDCLASMGRLAVVSSAKGAEARFSPLDLLIGGKQIIGVHQGDSRPGVFIPELMAHYRAGRFPFDRLVSFYPFAEINRALEDLRSGAAIKPILRL